MASWSEKICDLPPNRRHIATHNAEGKSVYVSSAPPQVYVNTGGPGLAHSYSIAAVPVKMENDADLKAYLSEGQVNSQKSTHIVVPETPETPNGANLLVVDLPPGAVSGMHRTLSIDFSICVIGTIIHELDSGEKVVLKPGDHIVQRGTMHKWHNASDTEPARFVAVTLPAVPFPLPGTGEMLREIHVPNTNTKL
ncbi:uncharacterized protein PV09_04510 [Verruconis gallopava]|uniref:Cupin type-2 domain-containing protein n=1 Tax=Verruconis gallopava TaxID=253628 RepID=A0A0D1YU48_9PEZI|nr:uncharacterized protein PV09_04510 [Verruconis gallopava]KIW04202.1 hypothetical protein PV09_04510 [Verruconis gallopava]